LHKVITLRRYDILELCEDSFESDGRSDVLSVGAGGRDRGVTRRRHCFVGIVVFRRYGRVARSKV
jgi:hypothetical protein